MSASGHDYDVVLRGAGGYCGLVCRSREIRETSSMVMVAFRQRAGTQSHTQTHTLIGPCNCAEKEHGAQD